jgi:hypothetical protein
MLSFTNDSVSTENIVFAFALFVLTPHFRSFFVPSRSTMFDFTSPLSNDSVSAEKASFALTLVVFTFVVVSSSLTI